MKSILLATALALTAIAPSLAATDSESRPQIKINTDINGEIAPGIKIKPIDTEALKQKLGDAPRYHTPLKKATDYNVNNLSLAVLGEGTMHDDLVSQIYSASVSETPEYSMTILYEQTKKDVYVIRPYSSIHPNYNLLNSNGRIDSSFDYTIIDASDNGYVLFQPFKSGVKADITGSGLENLVLVSFNYILEKLGYYRSDIKSEGYGGLNDDGHIYFPEGLVLVTTPSVYNYFNTLDLYSLEIDELNDYFLDISADGLWGFYLPKGSASYNFLGLSSEQMCYDDDNIMVDIVTGKNISYIKATIFDSFDPDNYISDTNNNGTKFTCDPNNPLKISASITDPYTFNDRVYFSVIAFNSLGYLVDADCIELFRTKDDASLWSEPVGAALTDGIVAPMYDELKVYSHDVKVQRLKSNPNYMRIVNPYSSPWTYAYKNIFCKPASRDAESSAHNHNHYIYIDATDPSAVVLETSPIGFMIDSEEGEAVVSSKAAIGIDSDGMTKEQMKAQGVTGTFANNSITFPANSLAFKTHKTSKEYYITNPNGEFELRFFTSPGETTAVDTITTDNDAADAVYYNLQGVEISADKLTPGVYIRRQGNEAKKVLIK